MRLTFQATPEFESSPGARFFKAFSKLDSVSCYRDDRLFNDAPRDILLFSKDDQFIYTACNDACIELQNANAEKDIVGLDDYTIGNLELYQGAAEIQAQDIRCMKNGALWHRCVFIDNNYKTRIFETVRIPVRGKKKSIGVIVAGIDITDIFMNGAVSYEL